MGVEFNILKDLATINNTAIELVAVDRIIRSHITSPVFMAEYNSLLADIVSCYQVVLDNCKPLIASVTKEGFDESFGENCAQFLEHYLSEISRPREFAEFVYEKNLQFIKLKEVNTSFPILKRSFSRLREIIDKWLDNDIWLAMTIDSLFKLLARLLKEVAGLKDKDPEDALLVYLGATTSMSSYLITLDQQIEALSEPLKILSVDLGG